MDNVILCVSFLQPKDLTIPLDASLLFQQTQQIYRCIFPHIWCDHMSVLTKPPRSSKHRVTLQLQGEKTWSRRTCLWHCNPTLPARAIVPKGRSANVTEGHMHWDSPRVSKFIQCELSFPAFAFCNCLTVQHWQYDSHVTKQSRSRRTDFSAPCP